MRMNWMLTTAVVAMAGTAAASAQSAKAMGTSSKSDAMGMTYTGCVESVNHGAVYLLTRVARAESRHNGEAMKHNGDMAMKGDAASRMQYEQAPMADPKMDAMSSKSFALAGSANLNKHVGQRISVTGAVSDPPMGTMRLDVPTLTVKTLKVIAKSCS
jgi:hypothetical protein